MAAPARRPAVPPPSPLAELVELGERLAEKAQANPLKWRRWTAAQDAFLRLDARRKLIRGGNQAIGKTEVALAELIYRCLGQHPFLPVRPAPIEAWVVCSSWDQSIPIQKKFVALVPDDQVDWQASSNYTERRAFGKDAPTVILKSGSIVRFKTTEQGALRYSGATIDVVLIDEPCDYDIYRELDRRVMKRGGVVLLSLTPINVDVGWLRAMVDRGTIREVHARLTVANTTPVGASEPLCLDDDERTPMDEAWIAQQRRDTPRHVAPIILDGEWEGSPEGVYFSAVWDRKAHVRAVKLDPRLGNIRWCLGIDFAAANRPMGLVAILAQVQQQRDDKGRVHDLIYVRDEVCLPGSVPIGDFAREILRMLARCGIEWHHLDVVYGDNPAESFRVIHSNELLENSIARELGMPPGAYPRPRVFNAKRGQRSGGAVDAGIRYLWGRMAGKCFLIDPGCGRLQEAIETWEYGIKDHPAKDRIDALRYALRDYVFPQVPRVAAPVRIW